MKKKPNREELFRNLEHGIEELDIRSSEYETMKDTLRRLNRLERRGELKKDIKEYYEVIENFEHLEGYKYTFSKEEGKRLEERGKAMKKYYEYMQKTFNYYYKDKIYKTILIPVKGDIEKYMSLLNTKKGELKDGIEIGEIIEESVRRLSWLKLIH